MIFGSVGAAATPFTQYIPLPIFGRPNRISVGVFMGLRVFNIGVSSVAVDYLERCVENGKGVILGKKEFLGIEAPIWSWDIINFRPNLSN